MSWQQSRPAFQIIRDNWGAFFPNLKPVSLAPILSALEELADLQRRSYDAVIREEAETKYKSVQTATGDIYIQQNPALRGTQYWRGERQLAITFVQAQKIIKKRAEIVPLETEGQSW